MAITLTIIFGLLAVVANLARTPPDDTKKNLRLWGIQSYLWAHSLPKPIRRIVRSRLLVAALAVAAASSLLMWLRTDEPAHRSTSESARIQISHPNISGPTPAFELSAVSTVRNAGNLSATITRKGAQPAFTMTANVLSGEEENNDWEKFDKGTKRDANSTLQIAPGATWKYGGNFSILGKEEYEWFQASNFLIYYMILIEHKDESLKAGEYWITESCYYFSKSFSRANLCHGHNRSYLSP